MDFEKDIRKKMWILAIRWNGISRITLFFLTIFVLGTTIISALFLLYKMYWWLLFAIVLVGWPMSNFMIFWCVVRGDGLKMLENDYKRGVLSSIEYIRYRSILEKNKKDLDLLERRLKKYQENEQE